MGKSHLPEYGVWEAIKQRCTNPKDKSYHKYGGRGITLCKEWENFDQFYKDMGPRPSSKHTIERIDNNKGYSKENCKWATRIEQNRNTRRNHIVEYKGEKKSIAEWAEIYNINYATLWSRIYIREWSIEKSINYKTRTKRVFIEYNNQTRSLNEWAKITQIPYYVIRLRLNANWSTEEIFETPYKKREKKIKKEPKDCKKYLQYNGDSLSMSDWSRKTGISAKRISARIKAGWSVEKTLTTPAKGFKNEN